MMFIANAGTPVVAGSQEDVKKGLRTLHLVVQVASREQVRQVLGTPLLTDMFRSNRWDYVFTAQHRKGVEPQKYAVAVFFEGDALARIEGAEDLPSETEFVERMSDGKVYKPRNLEASPEKLQSFTDSQKAKAKPQPELPEAPSTTSYPALPQ